MSFKSNFSSISDFTTSPISQSTLSPKLIIRKAQFNDFSKKKITQSFQQKQIDRVKFISPSKTSFLVNGNTLEAKNAFNMVVIKNTHDEDINYKFIKNCVSPNNGSPEVVASQQIFNPTLKESNNSSQFDLSTIIEDFSNYQIKAENSSSHNLQQEMIDIKKQNQILQIIINNKNYLIDQQKIEHESKTNAFVKHIHQLGNIIQNKNQKLAVIQNRLIEIQNKLNQKQNKLLESQNIFVQTEKKLLQYQRKCKQFSLKLKQENQQRDKITKQLKMYKNKFKQTVYQPRQQIWNRKYHKNCCHDNFLLNLKQNKRISIQKTNQNLNKVNQKQIQSKKIVSLSQSPERTLKQIKSQHVFPTFNSYSPQNAMKMHDYQDEYNRNLELEIQIEQLINQIRYKDIQIMTLKKTKIQLEKEQIKNQKTKINNRKLLARVEFLTKQYESFKHLQQKKKTHKNRRNNKLYDEQGDISIQLFELSPQKHHCNEEINY